MATQKKRKILLIEDEAISAMVTGKNIEKFGYDVSIVHSGEAALETIKKREKLDLILVDIELGKGIDGIETARQILRKKNIPIVFLTSHTDKEYFNKIKKITRYGYILKNSANLVLQSSIEMAFALFDEHEKTVTSETRYKNFIHYSTEGIYRIDIIPPVSINLPREEIISHVNKHALISEANNALAETYGLEPDDMIGRKAVHFSPDYGERAVFIINSENLRVKNKETTYLDRKGNKLYLEESYHGEVENGFLLRIWGVQRNVSERRQALQKLRQSEADYKSTIDNLQVGVVVHDYDTKIIISNREASRILGLTEDQIAGKMAIDPAWNFTNEDSSIMEQKDYPVNRVILTERPLGDHIVGINRPDRDYITWVNTNATPMFSETGKLERIIVNFADITERKEMNEALEKRITSLTGPLGESSDISFDDLFSLEEIQRLQDEFASSHRIASIITTTDGIPITVPSNFTRLCSEVIRCTEKGRANCFKSDAVLGKGNPDGPVIQQCMSGGLWDAGTAITVGGRHIANWLIGQVRDETPTEETIRSYAREIGADEDAAAIALRDVPVMSREHFGRIAQSLFTLASQLSSAAYQNIRQARHISRARQLQSDLKAAQSYIENIINSMPSILIGVDTKGNVSQWNKKAEEITGIDAEEAKGKRLSTVYPEMSSEMDKITESIKSLEVISETKSSRLTDEGPCYENITVYPLTSNGIRGAVIRIDDVTRQYQLEEQLNQSRKMDAIGQLAGGIAHDFNNMLGGIMSAAQLIENREKLDTRDQKYIGMIIQTSRRAADLTAKLLTFARKGKITSMPIDVHSILKDTLVLLERSIDKTITITINKQAEKCIILGDDAQLQNALLNICINAGHAMPRGGEISITTDNLFLNDEYCETSPFNLTPGEYLEVIICDTGTGIPAENITKIFEPFFTTREQGKGTGLGLAAVYGTIQNHHGAVTVSSEPGAGTTFTIYLPLSSQKADKMREEDVIHTGTGQILLVDDEKIIRVTAAEMLTEMNYQVISAENGIEALHLFRTRHQEIDLVILDMIMPKMNGREVFEKIREIDQNAKVIISSGFSQIEALEELKQKGLYGFINKPYRQNELSVTIKEVMAGRKTL